MNKFKFDKNNTIIIILSLLAIMNIIYFSSSIFRLNFEKNVEIESTIFSAEQLNAMQHPLSEEEKEVLTDRYLIEDQPTAIQNMIIYFDDESTEHASGNVQNAVEQVNFLIESNTKKTVINLKKNSGEAVLLNLTIYDENKTINKIVLNDKNIYMDSLDTQIFNQVMQMLIAFIILGAIYIIFIKKMRIHKIYAIVAFSFGMLFVFIMSPASIPDEAHHHKSSYCVSNILMFNFDNIEEAREDHIHLKGSTLHKNVPQAYNEIINTPLFENSDSPISKMDEPYGYSYPLQYVPQAIGISVGRTLNLSGLWIYYLGRITGLAFFVGCLYFAIKRVPRFKTMFFLIGMMPMSLHQAASYSYDGFINGVSLLLIAYMIALIVEKGKISKNDLIVIAMFSALLAPAKIVYTGILLFLILVPTERFGGIKQKILALAALLGICFFSILLFSFQQIITLMVGSSEAHVNAIGDVERYSISYALNNPIHTLRVFFNTFSLHGVKYAYDSIGRLLSGHTIIIHSSAIFVYLVMLFTCGLSNCKGEKAFDWKSKLVMLIIFTSISFAIAFALFIDWTPLGSDIILGLQGRYFIPLIPFALLLVNNKYIYFKEKHNGYLIMIAIIIVAYVIKYVLDFTIVG